MFARVAALGTGRLKNRRFEAIVDDWEASLRSLGWTPSDRTLVRYRERAFAHLSSRLLEAPRNYARDDRIARQCARKRRRDLKKVSSGGFTPVEK